MEFRTQSERFLLALLKIMTDNAIINSFSGKYEAIYRLLNKYNVNDTVFFIESNRIVRKAEIVKFAGGLYTIRFAHGNGGIKVRESRLFATKQEAIAALPKPKPEPRRPHPTPWD